MPIPTVNTLTTTDTTPIITGTFDASEADTLTVAIDGTTYTLGTDAELTNVGDTWQLDRSAATPLAVGTYDVVVTVTSAYGSSQDATTGEITIEASPPAGAITPKSIAFDIDNRWDTSGSGRTGVRSIEFLSGGSVIPMTSGFTAYASNITTASYSADQAFDTSLSKTGGASGNSWLGALGVTPERLTIVFDTPPTIDEIRVNNYHNSGGSTTSGSRNVKITWTPDTIDQTTGETYEAAISNGTILNDTEWAEHVGSDVEDDQTVWTAPTSVDNAIPYCPPNNAADHSVDLDIASGTADTAQAGFTEIEVNSDSVTTRKHGVFAIQGNHPLRVGDPNVVDAKVKFYVTSVTSTPTLRIGLRPSTAFVPYQIHDDSQFVFAPATPSPTAAGLIEVDVTAALKQIQPDTSNSPSVGTFMVRVDIPSDNTGSVTIAAHEHASLDPLCAFVLIGPPAPTVNSQTTGDTTPIITGTYTAAETDTLTVTLDGTTYTAGVDAELTTSGDTWQLDRSAATPLAVGIYDVVVAATNANGTTNDATTDELVIAYTTTVNADYGVNQRVSPPVQQEATLATIRLQDDDDVVAELDLSATLQTSATIDLATLYFQIPAGDYHQGSLASVYVRAADSLPMTAFESLTGWHAGPSGQALFDTTTGNNTFDVTSAVQAAIAAAAGPVSRLFAWIVCPETASPINRVIASEQPGANTGPQMIIVATSAPPAPTVTSQTTGDTTPIITGGYTAAETTTLTVAVNSTTYTQGVDSELSVSGDTWQLDLSSIPPLAPGTYDVTATATNATGATSDVTTGELTINPAAPTAPTVTPLLTGDTTPIIQGTYTAAETVTLTVAANGTTYTAGVDSELTTSGNTWQLDLSSATPLAVGNYEIVATATNAGGSTADVTSTELTIIAPPTAPTVNVLSTGDLTPTITGTYTPAETDTLSAAVNGTTYTHGTDSELSVSGNTWSLNLDGTTPLPVATYDVTVTATNAAGSTTDSTTNELTILPDLTPTVVLDDPDAEDTVEAGYVVTLTCKVTKATGGANVSSVVFSLDGQPLGDATDLGDDEYAFNWTAAGSGNRTLSVLVTDESSLTATDSVDFVVTGTNTGPSLSITAPAAAAELALGQATTISVSVSDSDGLASVTVEAGSQTITLSDAGGGTWSGSWTPSTLGSVPLEVTAVDSLNATATADRSVYVTGTDADGNTFETANAGERGYFVVSTQSRTDNVVQSGNNRLAYARFVDVGPAHGRVVTRTLLELDTAPSSGIVVEAIAVDEPAAVSTYAELTGRARIALAVPAGAKSIDITDLLRGLAASETRAGDADVLLLVRSTDAGDATVTHTTLRLSVWSSNATMAVASGNVALWIGAAPVEAWQATIAIAETPKPGWQLGVVLDGLRFYAQADVGETAAQIALRLAAVIQTQSATTGVTANASGREILLTATDEHRHSLAADFAVVPSLTTLRPGQREIPQRQEFRLPITRSGQFSMSVTAEGLETATDALLADATPEDIGQKLAALCKQIGAGSDVTISAESMGVSLTDLDHERIAVDLIGLDTAVTVSLDVAFLVPSEGSTETTIGLTRAANALHQLACDPDAGGAATLIVDDVEVSITPGDGLDLLDSLTDAGIPAADIDNVRGRPGLLLIQWDSDPDGRPVDAVVRGTFTPPVGVVPVRTSLSQRGTGPNYLDDPRNFANELGLAPGRILVMESADVGPTQGLQQWAIATSAASGEISADLDYARNQRVNVWADGATPLPSGLDAETEYVIADDDRTDGVFRLETTAGAPVTPAAGSFRIGPRLAGLDLKSTFASALGRPRRTDQDQWVDTARYARLAFTNDAEVIIGEGAGRGAELIRLDLGDFAGNVEILVSGNGAEEGRPAICLLGDGSATLEVADADVGIAEWPDESATFGTIKQTAGTIHLGRGGVVAGGKFKQGGLHLEGTMTTTPIIRP